MNLFAEMKHYVNNSSYNGKRTEHLNNVGDIIKNKKKNKNVLVLFLLV